jgi:threonine dehydratase
MACIAKSLKPEIKIVGVQCGKYPEVKNAFDKINNDSLHNGITIAEGIAVKTPGKLTLECIEHLVDDVITVSEEEIDEAIYTYLNIEKAVAEGAGAVSLAAVMTNLQYFAGRCVDLVLSGANIDARILSTILMRNPARSGLIVQLQIASNDTPGSLAEIAGYIGRFGANILEVNHQRAFTRVCICETLLHLMIEVKDKNDTDKLIDVLRQASYSVERLVLLITVV